MVSIGDDKGKIIYETALSTASKMFDLIPKTKLVNFNKSDYAKARAVEALVRSGYKKCEKGHYAVGSCPLCHKESLSSSQNGQVTRKPVKLKLSLREAQIKDATKRLAKVIILKEGRGNKVDRHFYTKDALMSAVAMFEGAQCYCDHPSRSDEVNRPERSVREIVGHFEGVAVETDTDGLGILTGDLKIINGESFTWAWDLLVESVEYSQKYPDKSLIGVSINADGDSEPFDLDGETWQKVNIITKVVSADLVTKAGAGGKPVQIKESEKGNRKKSKLKEGKKMSEAKKLMAEMKEKCEALKKEAEGDDKYASAIDEILSKITKILDLEQAEHGEDGGEKKEEAETENEDEKKEDESEDGEKKPTPPAKDEEEEDEKKKESAKEIDTLKNRVALLESTIDEEKKSSGIAKILKESTLPEGFKTKMSKSLKGKTLKEAAAEVKDLETYFKKHTFKEVSMPEKGAEAGSESVIGSIVKESTL